MFKNVNITDFWKESFKGSLFATIFSLFLVLVFALVIRFFALNADVVPALNVIIKISSVFFAVLIVCKQRDKVFLKGILIAIGFVFLSNILFLLPGGELHFGNVIKDIEICIIAVFIGSIVSVYRKK